MQIITFWGLEINTVDEIISVPRDKVLSVSRLITQALRKLSKRKISLKSIQSLVGSLNFVCGAIPPGRAFLRRLIGFSAAKRKSYCFCSDIFGFLAFPQRSGKAIVVVLIFFFFGLLLLLIGKIP